MGYEYRIEVSAQRSDVETILGRVPNCQREGSRFVYQGSGPAEWPDATAEGDEKGIYFLANSCAGKSVLGSLLVALTSLGPVKVEEL